MVGLQLPKLITWVRFPSPAPLAAHRCMPRTPRSCRLEPFTRQWLPRFYPHTHLKRLHQPPGKRTGAVCSARPTISNLHGDCARRSHVPQSHAARHICLARPEPATGADCVQHRCRLLIGRAADWHCIRIKNKQRCASGMPCPAGHAARQWLRAPIAPGRPRLAAPARHRRHCPFRSGQPR